MSKLKKVRRTFLFVVGYILSPLSWWNDLFVNIPLAYCFAVAVGTISSRLFTPGLVLGYWLSNVLGLIMMHLGYSGRDNIQEEFTGRQLFANLAFSLLYTGIIALAVKIGWLSFPSILLKK